MTDLSDTVDDATKSMDDFVSAMTARTTQTHEAYLKSHYWRKRKAEYFSRNPRQCFLCSKVKNIHLHHRTYVRLNEEIDDDLVRLCGKHHQELHMYENNYDVTVEEATDIYLAYKAHCDYARVIADPKLRKILEEQGDR